MIQEDFTLNLIVLIAALGYLLGLATVLHALLNVRTPQGTAGWVVALITIPFVSVPFYWLVGRRRFVGYLKAKRLSDSEVRAVLARDAPFGSDIISHQAKNHRVLGALSELASVPMLTGNGATLLDQGEAYFDSVIDGLDRARKYALVQFYIVCDDSVGRRLQLKLIDLASRGVKVSFLYDAVGSYGLKRRYIHRLLDAGVRVSSFRSTRGKGTPLQINFRNHRKLVVVDGLEAWLGGHNFADEYLKGDPKLGDWRDTSLHLAGPAALAVQRAFLEDWYWATDQSLALNWQAASSPGGDADVLILPSGPADEAETGALMFQQVIHGARERVWLASPYFVPDMATINALQLAALRGVDVRILIPERADHRVVYWACFAFEQDLSGFDVGIFRYQNGFMHQKVMLIDDLAAVGTANLDNRSMRLNFELTAFVAGTEFVASAEQMLLRDFEGSIEDPPDVFDRLPAWKRIRSRAAYLAAPLL